MTIVKCTTVQWIYNGHAYNREYDALMAESYDLMVQDFKDSLGYHVDDWRPTLLFQNNLETVISILTAYKARNDKIVADDLEERVMHEIAMTV